MRVATRLALAFLLACGSSARPAPSGPTAALGGAVAVAGDVPIDASLVAAVAAKNDETPQKALDSLLFDAVLAQGARAKKLDAAPDVRTAERAVLARLVTDRLLSDARARGAPTDEEVEKLTKRHWRDVDLPEQARAVHVVVLTPKDPAKLARARALAEKLRQAVLGASDAADFIARAKKVDPEGLDVRPEELPRFVADGRVVDGDGTFDSSFCAAAFPLAAGQTSDVVETRFGFHVIRMLEKLPGKHLSLEERRARFAEEAVTLRARRAYTALLADARRRHPVVVDPAADALMASATAP